jgi:hypothetical protein
VNYSTTRAHLAELMRAISKAIQRNLSDGRFACADELRAELAWLGAELGTMA